MEHLSATIGGAGVRLLDIAIYRSPASAAGKFLDEFADLLDSTVSYSSLVSRRSEPAPGRRQRPRCDSVPVAAGRQQHVSGVTDVGRHLLDVVVTRGDIPARQSSTFDERIFETRRSFRSLTDRLSIQYRCALPT